MHHLSPSSPCALTARTLQVALEKFAARYLYRRGKPAGSEGHWGPAFAPHEQNVALMKLDGPYHSWQAVGMADEGDPIASSRWETLVCRDYRSGLALYLDFNPFFQTLQLSCDKSCFRKCDDSPRARISRDLIEGQPEDADSDQAKYQASD